MRCGLRLVLAVTQAPIRVAIPTYVIILNFLVCTGIFYSSEIKSNGTKVSKLNSSEDFENKFCN